MTTTRNVEKPATKAEAGYQTERVEYKHRPDFVSSRCCVTSEFVVFFILASGVSQSEARCRAKGALGADKMRPQT